MQRQLPFSHVESKLGMQIVETVWQFYGDDSESHSTENMDVMGVNTPFPKYVM